MFTPPDPQTRDILDVHPSKAVSSSSDEGGGLSAHIDRLLSTHHVRKAYKGREVVSDISVHVRPGEAVGLLGPNGAGKTTLFYMITGLVQPDFGSVQLNQHDITSLPMYQRARLGIGYLPQEASIFRGLSVEDNIRAILEVREKNRQKQEEQLNHLLEEFDIKRLRKFPSVA